MAGKLLGAMGRLMGFSTLRSPDQQFRKVSRREFVSGRSIWFFMGRAEEGERSAIFGKREPSQARNLLRGSEFSEG
jgi:hypothetical protein